MILPTTIHDVVVKEVLVDAVRGAFKPNAGRAALWGTRGVITNPSFPSGKHKVGDKVTVPYFGSIGEWEFIVDGAGFTPAKMEMVKEENLVMKIGKSFNVTDWQQMGGAGDPYLECARQTREGFDAICDDKLLAAMLAPLPTMTHDVYSGSYPRVLDGDILTDARIGLWGDEAEEGSLLVCRSKVETDLRKIKDATGRPIYTDPIEGSMPRIGGLSVGMSDKMPVSSDIPPKYTTAIVKPEALVIWYDGEPMVETDRDILMGADVVVVSTYVVVHRYARMPLKTKPGVVHIVSN